MFSFYSNDGRILTPPKELKPLLKESYPAFFKLIGHIRFFYIADEIWDGKSTIIFNAYGKELALITLEDSAFYNNIGDEKFHIKDESLLINIFDVLKKTALPKQNRPLEQLSVDLNEYPNGIRCDLCLLYKKNNENNDYLGNRKFPVMDRHCYYGVAEGWGCTEFSTRTCEGKEGCYTKTYSCLEKRGLKNCLDCGEYRTCNDCGVGHDPGECNLGITAEEVTNLIIPYCEIERLDLLSDSKK